MHRDEPPGFTRVCLKLGTEMRIASGSDLVTYLAVTDAESGKIVVLDGKGTNEVLHTVEKLHTKPVRLIQVRFWIPHLRGYCNGRRIVKTIFAILIS